MAGIWRRLKGIFRGSSSEGDAGGLSPKPTEGLSPKPATPPPVPLPTPGQLPPPPPPAANPPEAKPTLHAHVPDGWTAIDATKLSGKLRIDGLVAFLGNYTGEGRDYDFAPEDFWCRKLASDGGAFVIPMLIRHRGTGRKHALFYCLTAEEAQYVPYYEEQLALEPDWGASVYIGVVPYAELPHGEDRPRPDAIAFPDLFQHDPESTPTPGAYTVWRRAEGDLIAVGSPAFGAVMAAAETLRGYEPYVASILAAELTGQEFTGFLALPAEPVQIAAKGPDNEPVVVAIAREWGIALLTQVSAAPEYRRRLYTQLRDFARAVLDKLGEQLAPVQYPEGEASPSDYWQTTYGELLRGPYTPFSLAFTVGVADEEEVPIPPLGFDPEVVDLDVVFPRLRRFRGGLSEEDAQRYEPFAGDLYYTYAQHRPGHIVNLRPADFDALSEAQRANLGARAMANIATRLAEPGIQLGFNEARTFGYSAMDGAVTPLLPFYDALWERLDEQMGGDLAIALPADGALAIAKFTDADARAEAERYCAHVAGQVGDGAYWGDELYLWRGTDIGWQLAG